jgi:hypothetical protein
MHLIIAAIVGVVFHSSCMQAGHLKTCKNTNAMAASATCVLAIVKHPPLRQSA